MLVLLHLSDTAMSVGRFRIFFVQLCFNIDCADSANVLPQQIACINAILDKWNNLIMAGEISGMRNTC